MLTIGTTFSGIGAPEQALKNIGIETVNLWACDINKHARKVYNENHHTEMWYDDITKINYNELPKVDMYCFGSPCQDFSIAGKQDLSRGRSTLLWRSVNIIDAIRPNYILFENVKNILNKNFEIIRNDFISKLRQQYKLAIGVLNSKHFGVPQNRERLFIFGISHCLNKIPELPTGKNYDVRIRNILEPDANNFVEDNHRFYYESYRNARSGNYRQYKKPNFKDGEIDHESQINRLYYEDGIAPTLMTNKMPLILVNDKIRYFTIKEKLRLQGFPDNFKMNVSNTAAHFLIGNSITVPVLENIFSRNLL